MADKVTLVVEMTAAAGDPRATLERLVAAANPSSLAIEQRFDSADANLRRFLSVEVNSAAAAAVMSHLKESRRFVADVVPESDAEPG